jgi:hypothetical protein
MKWQVDEIACFQNDRQIKWMVDKMKGWWNSGFIKLWVNEMTGWWNSVVSELQFDEMNGRTNPMLMEKELINCWSMKWQGGKVASCQNDRYRKWQIDIMAGIQEDGTVKRSVGRITNWSNYRLKNGILMK